MRFLDLAKIGDNFNDGIESVTDAPGIGAPDIEDNVNCLWADAGHRGVAGTYPDSRSPDRQSVGCVEQVYR